MSVVVAEPKTGKTVRNLASAKPKQDRAARFRTKEFTRELTAVFHQAKLRALDATKGKA
jgi:hypothetical protein